MATPKEQLGSPSGGRAGRELGAINALINYMYRLDLFKAWLSLP